MINSSLLFLRQCESLDWSDCLVILLLSATHFRRSGRARLIRGCFSFSQCFWAGVFSSLSPPPPRFLWLALSPPLHGKFQHGAFASKLRGERKRLHCRLELSAWNYRQNDPGGTPGNSWWGCTARFFKSWPDFRPKNVIIHTRFQIWPFGQNYVIIT